MASKPAKTSGDPQLTILTADMVDYIQRGKRLYQQAMEDGQQAPMGCIRYWTASLQSVAHLIGQRTKDDAQYEFQEYAHAVKALADSISQSH